MLRKRFAITLFTFHLILLLLFTSCSKDETSQTYSTKYRVYCSFYVPTYTQLFNAMGSYGQFVKIRKTTRNGQSVFEMSSSLGTETYAIDETMKYNSYGLGGLIVGTNYYGENMAFDLSCPNCDRADRRLSIGDDDIAKCSKCGISYDLNAYGAISKVDSTSTITSPRGLYSYRIMYDGTNLTVYN